MSRGRALTPGQLGSISTRRIGKSWRASARYRPNNGDPTIRLSRDGDTEALAVRALKQAAGRGASIQASTVGELVEIWVRRHTGITQSTRERYQRNIERCLLPVIGEVRCDEVSAGIVQEALDTLALEGLPGVRPSVENARLTRTILSMALRFGATRGVVETNYTRDTTIAKIGTGRHRPQAPSEAQVDRLIEVLKIDLGSQRHGIKSPSAYLAAQIMRGTGARVSEVCALTWGDVDWQRKEITFRGGIVFEGKDLSDPEPDPNEVDYPHIKVREHLKNKDPRRTVKLPPWLYNLLVQYGGPRAVKSKPIIEARRGTSEKPASNANRWMAPNNLRRSWRRAYARVAPEVDLKDRVAPHDLRRYVGTKIARALGSDAAASQLGDTPLIAQKHYVEPDYRGPIGAATIL